MNRITLGAFTCLLIAGVATFVAGPMLGGKVLTAAENPLAAIRLKSPQGYIMFRPLRSLRTAT